MTINETGATGEKIAADYLKNKGYDIVAMNFKNDSGRRLGEIDIIAKDQTTGDLVFVEVKTRDYAKYKDTLPEDNITHSKLRKLSKIASVYLYAHKLQEANYRFDAISVWLDIETRMAKVKHLPNIFL